VKNKNERIIRGQDLNYGVYFWKDVDSVRVKNMYTALLVNSCTWFRFYF